MNAAPTAPDETAATPRTPPGELANYRDYLDHYRQTLARQTDGLSVQELATPSVPPSTLSLLGLIRHLAKVEHHWFRRVIEGRADLPRLYSGDDPDLDFAGVTTDEADAADAFDTWRADPGPPHRGVCPSRRPRGPAPRAHRRRHRVVASRPGWLVRPRRASGLARSPDGRGSMPRWRRARGRAGATAGR